MLLCILVHNSAKAGTTLAMAITDSLSSARQLTIARVLYAPKLEDFLGNQVGGTQVEVNDFRQYEPGDGTPSSQKTLAYLSYDSQNLYVVFVCKDEAGKVRAHMEKREDISKDDRVQLYLDTFHDGQRAYVFEANPLGIQRDGLLIEGQSIDYNFDTVWQSAGRVTRDGYIVWMAIPFRSLRFSSAPVQTWGIALGRTILRTGETTYWPYITKRTDGFVNQMAVLDGLQDISPSHNMEFEPHGIFTAAKYLDKSIPAYRTNSEGREGLDGKIILHNSLALDITANPDFSQVESDDPQVLVNQRYEVTYPEKRPFFLENAGYFQTPVQLFYSRRIVDPQYGARITGKVGPWAVGAFGIDDRAQGELLDPTDPNHGDRSVIAVARLQRDLWTGSNIGVLATSREFGPSFNRVFSLDTRLRLTPHWVLTGQFMHSDTLDLKNKQYDGFASELKIARSGRSLSFSSKYDDFSPNFHTDLGYIKRVDIRTMTHYASYTWWPDRRYLLSLGPDITGVVNWDHEGRIQDKNVTVDFTANFTGQTSVTLSRFDGVERYGDVEFRKYLNSVSVSTSWLKSLSLYASYDFGKNINYSPPSTLAPFLAPSDTASFTIGYQPLRRLRFDGTYIYARLGNNPDLGIGGSSAFNNHIAQLKVNYQFTRAMSLRSIVQYYGVLPNPSLVDLYPTKQVVADFLLTYLVHPGTALYIGYTNEHDNVFLDPSTSPPSVGASSFPGTLTGSQVFVKLSYLYRY